MAELIDLEKPIRDGKYALDFAAEFGDLETFKFIYEKSKSKKMTGPLAISRQKTVQGIWSFLEWKEIEKARLPIFRTLASDVWRK